MRCMPSMQKAGPKAPPFFIARAPASGYRKPQQRSCNRCSMPAQYGDSAIQSITRSYQFSSIQNASGSHRALLRCSCRCTRSSTLEKITANTMPSAAPKTVSSTRSTGMLAATAGDAR